MSMPGFTSTVPLFRNKSQGYVTRTYVAPDLKQSEGKVLPQAQECVSSPGPCTGFWPWYQGTQCITGYSGAQQCCTNASTYPVIRECLNPDGTWRVVNRYCGYCWL